jgi:hypothetical protein
MIGKEAAIGWFRYFMLGNFGQQLDIQDQERHLEQLRSQLLSREAVTARSNTILDQLHQENDQLKLYIVAHTRMLTGKGVCSEAELQAMVNAVDLEAGSRPPPTAE